MLVNLIFLGLIRIHVWVLDQRGDTQSILTDSKNVYIINIFVVFVLFLKFSQMLVIKAMKNQDLSFNLIFILLEIQYF